MAPKVSGNSSALVSRLPPGHLVGRDASHLDASHGPVVAPSTVEQLNMAVGRLSPIVTCHPSGHLHEDGKRPPTGQPPCTSRTRIVIQYRELNIATVPNIRGKKSSRMNNKIGSPYSPYTPPSVPSCLYRTPCPSPTQPPVNPRKCKRETI